MNDALKFSSRVVMSSPSIMPIFLCSISEVAVSGLVLALRMIDHHHVIQLEPGNLEFLRVKVELDETPHHFLFT